MISRCSIHFQLSEFFDMSVCTMLFWNQTRVMAVEFIPRRCVCVSFLYEYVYIPFIYILYLAVYFFIINMDYVYDPSPPSCGFGL